MNESICSNREVALKILNELVLDHLGIPRPGQSENLKTLQDDLLPAFVRTSRQAWFAASPIQLLQNDMAYQYLNGVSQTEPNNISALNNILEDLGVHDLLRDFLSSSHKNMMGDLPVDPYEERLLKEAGYPNPASALREIICRAAQDYNLTPSPSKILEDAAQVTLNVQGDINIYMNPPYPPQPGNIKPDKAKRRKLFSGLGKLFSGLVLLAGNGIAIPTVIIGSITALPLLSSFAGGIAAVGEGIGQLRREGE